MEYSFRQKILFFLFLSPIILFGQSTTDEYLEKNISAIDISEADWAKVVKDLKEPDWGKVDKDEAQEAIQQPTNQQDSSLVEKRTEGSGFTLPNFGGGSGIFSFLFKILIIGVLIAIVLLLLKHLAGAEGFSRPSNRTFRSDEPIDTQTVAERIHDYDLKTLIERAINEQDYTVATRLYYLFAIKTASDKGLIKWKKDKTNRDYLNEIQSMGLKEQFRQLTYIFERAWYGETVIEATDFVSVEKQFKTFINAID